MSYPMNEIVTDLERAVGTAIHRAGDDLSSALERGKDSCLLVGKRAGREAAAALHRNPYPTVLLGITAGALMGYLISGRLKKRCH